MQIPLQGVILEGKKAQIFSVFFLFFKCKILSEAANSAKNFR